MKDRCFADTDRGVYSSINPPHGGGKGEGGIRKRRGKGR